MIGRAAWAAGWFLAAAAAGWAALLYPGRYLAGRAGWDWGPRPAELSAAALACCAVPATLALVLRAVLAARPPQERLAGEVCGFTLRLFGTLTLSLAAIAGPVARVAGASGQAEMKSFWVWVLSFYAQALAYEVFSAATQAPGGPKAPRAERS